MKGHRRWKAAQGRNQTEGRPGCHKPGQRGLDLKAMPRNQRSPGTMLVVDESSPFKNPNSMRFKALKKVQPSFKRVVGK